MTITKLLVVIFIAALCDNVGASQLSGMPNTTKLMEQKLQLQGIGQIIGDIIDTIIDILGNNTSPINTTIPTLPNNTSPAPSPEGGLVDITPSLAPQGEVTNGAEAPLSVDIIGIVPSLAPEGEGPLNGGIIVSAPSPVPQGGATTDTEVPLSGGAIGVPPSLPPIGGGTEASLTGGVIGVSTAANDIGPPILVDVGVARVSTESRIVFTTKNFGSEYGSNGGSSREP